LSARTVLRTESANVVLVDTSAWIEVFRRPARLVIDQVVDFDDIVTCLPVVQEVLQGFTSDSAFRAARESMLALPMVEAPLRLDVYADAVELYRRARRAGITVRSGVDCLVAACALRHDLIVLHKDRDYTALARISTLRERQI
jgi:predicted nucleic acid-binding protein